MNDPSSCILTSLPLGCTAPRGDSRSVHLSLQVGRSATGWVQRAFQSTSIAAAAQPRAVGPVDPVTDAVPEDCPVCAYNEWDPLEEVIVGRAENARVPPFSVEVKVDEFKCVGGRASVCLSVCLSVCAYVCVCYHGVLL